MKQEIDIKPLGSRLIVLKDKMEDKTSGGIYIPDSAKETMKDSAEGTVIISGDECSLFKEGDTVFFGKYAGINIRRNDKEYMFLNEEDILGIVNKKA